MPTSPNGEESVEIVNVGTIEVEVEPLEVMARGPLALAVFKQFVQVSPLVKSQAKGEVVVAVMICPPFPARSPLTVVVPLSAITPVEELYERGEVAEREVEPTLLLNKVQSVEAKHPNTEPEAVSQVAAPPE